MPNDTNAAEDWFEREAHFAVDAHELTASLEHEIDRVLGDEPGPAEYAKAAQMIACTRRTCGMGAGHEHMPVPEHHE